MVYLGIFSFKNPDQEAWYGQASGVSTLYNTKEIGLAASALELTNIHDKFHTWFLWGFIVLLMVVVFYIVIGACFLTEKGAEIVIVGTMQNIWAIVGILSIFSLQSLVWWILGIVWRFNSVGQFSSGDIVPQGTAASAWLE